MKKKFILLIIAAFVGLNFNQLSKLKNNNNIHLNSLFAEAKADVEYGGGSCRTVSEMTSYSFECSTGITYSDDVIIYSCESGNDPACLEGGVSHQVLCDGSHYHNDWVTEVWCN